MSPSPIRGWRFSGADVFEALKVAYAAQDPRPENGDRTLRATGWRDAWVVEVMEEHNCVVIGAPAATMVELVAWVRAYVPADVALEVWDTAYTFDPRPLPPGITTEQLVAERPLRCPDAGLGLR